MKIIVRMETESASKKRKIGSTNSSAIAKKNLLTDILKYVRLLQSDTISTYGNWESGLEELCSDLTQYRQELDILSPEMSPEELSNWLNVQEESLLSIAESVDLTTLKSLKTVLISLKKTESAKLSSSASTGTTSMYSTIVPFLTQHANVSEQSFLNEEQRDAILSNNYMKATSQKLSSITITEENISTTLKADKPNITATHLIQLKVIDLREVERKGLSMKDSWKAAILKSDYYLKASTPGTQREVFLLAAHIKDLVFKEIQSEQNQTSSTINLD